MSDIEVTTTKAQKAIAIREKVNVKDISQAMGRMYGELAAYTQKNGIQMVGPPFAYYHSWSDQDTELECGFPVGGEVKTTGRIRPFVLPSVRAVTATHIGPYQALARTYEKVTNFMKDNGLQPADHMWEIYLNDPASTPPEELKTEIIWPIK